MKLQQLGDFLLKIIVLVGKGLDLALNYTLDIIDKRQIIRRLTFLMTLVMTYKTWEWSLSLVEPTTQQLGLLAAVNMLLGGMFKFYNDSRDKDA